MALSPFLILLGGRSRFGQVELGLSGVRAGRDKRLPSLRCR